MDELRRKSAGEPGRDKADEPARRKVKQKRAGKPDRAVSDATERIKDRLRGYEK